MGTFPESMAFRGSWRPYQARVLAELTEHLDDDRLHLVAAPGSGKTIVGLETIRRLDERTLVVAPTLTVRDQWIRRLDMFLDETPNWVGTDLDDPHDLTVVTYQALHQALPDDRDRLAKAGFGTLVLDEAHHLRRSWWDTLMQVRDVLEEPRIVALTATPPYDVPDQEWDNYVELCGSVDAEISIPELVREGHLCPHRDLVHLCTPTAKETRQIAAFRDDGDAIVDEVVDGDAFPDGVVDHPWAASPREHLDAIRDRPLQATALAIYLGETRWWPPWRLLGVLGLSRRHLPDLDRRWLEELLSLVVSADPPIPQFNVRSWRDRLDEVGALHRGRVHLRWPPWIEQTIRDSPGKLDGVAEIVRVESQAVGDDLRLVVLADRVRADHLPDDGDETELGEVGTVPIFERLRRAGDDPAIAMLTGSLVIVPVDAEPALSEAAGASDVALDPLDVDDRYAEMTVDGPDSMVPVVTEAFEGGAIRVLVGTAALLGEGWDAPATNALVLASNVGSAMMSNQMRGRAIRVDPDVPDKTANVWHVATVEPGRPDAGPDLQTLRRRFRTYVAPAEDGGIRNGLDRLDLPDPPLSEDDVADADERSRERARERDGIERTWSKALEGGDEVVETLEVPDDRLPLATARFGGVLVLALATALLLAAAWWSQAPPGPGLPLVGTAPYAGAAALAGLAVLAVGGRHLVRLFHHRSRSSSLGTLARIVAESLEAIDHVGETDRRIVVEARDRRLVCTIQGVTTQTRSRILDGLEDVLDPVDDTRYLLRRRPWPGLVRRARYRAVPEVLATKRPRAELFRTRWRRRVADVDLVYTRSGDGRLDLLRAQVRDLVAGTPTADRVKVWANVPDHPLREAMQRIAAAAGRTDEPSGQA